MQIRQLMTVLSVKVRYGRVPVEGSVQGRDRSGIALGTDRRDGASTVESNVRFRVGDTHRHDEFPPLGAPGPNG